MPKKLLRRKSRPKLQLRVELLERRDQPGSMIMVLSEGLMPFKHGSVPEPLPDRLDSVYEVSAQVHQGTNKSPTIGSKPSTVQPIEYTQSNAEATTRTFGSNFNSELSLRSSSKGLLKFLNSSNVDAPSTSGFGPSTAGAMPGSASVQQFGLTLGQSSFVAQPSGNGGLQSSGASSQQSVSAGASSGSSGGAVGNATSTGASVPNLSASAMNEIKAEVGTQGVHFEQNIGQSDSSVDYIVRGVNYNILLSGSSVVLNQQVSEGGEGGVGGEVASGHVLKMNWMGANQNVKGSGEQSLGATTNYFLGSQSQWLTNINNYQAVRYEQMYQGIDVVYYAAPTGGLEYDAVVAPGASVSDLQMRYEGADSVSVDSQGKLNIDLGFANVTKSAPVVYQFAADGSRDMIESKFSISDGNTVGFQVGEYDQSRPLIIDPTLGYSTFLGGSSDDVANDVAVDANNNVYITGTTMSTDMPNTAGQTSLGPSDAFLIKLSPTQNGGYTLGYSIIIGGGGEYDQRNGVIGYGEEKSYGVAVDANGSAYITGSTNSFNFPTTDGSSLVDPPPETSYSPPGTVVTNAFMAKFDSLGNIQYSTVFGRGRAAEGSYPYLGYNIEFQYADLEQVGRGIAVDNFGVAYITGNTFGLSTQNVPIGLKQPLPADKFHVYDAFVARIRTSANNLDGPQRVIEWNAAQVQGLATNGDRGWDSAYAIAVDSSRNVYITGKTNSPNLGTVAVGGSAAQANLAAPGAYDAFVMKMNGMLTTKYYSTFLGGSGSNDEVGYGIAVDSNNSAYVTGVGPASNFPTTPGAYETTKPKFNGSGSTFLTKVNPNGTAWSYSTFVDLPPGGSSRAVNAFSITLDSSNNAILAGQTVAESPARAMVAKVNSTGSAVLSSYVWGAPSLSMDFEPLLDTVGKGVAIDSTGKAYVVGYTLENEFQTTPNAYDATYNGNPYDFYATQDAFFSRITL